jgi:hypothetical protein
MIAPSIIEVEIIYLQNLKAKRHEVRSFTLWMKGDTVAHTTQPRVVKLIGKTLDEVKSLYPQYTIQKV